jgi:hypothetical protein
MRRRCGGPGPVPYGDAEGRSSSSFGDPASHSGGAKEFVTQPKPARSKAEAEARQNITWYNCFLWQRREESVVKQARSCGVGGLGHGAKVPQRRPYLNASAQESERQISTRHDRVARFIRLFPELAGIGNPVICRTYGVSFRWMALLNGKDCKVIVPHIADLHANAPKQGCGDMTIPTSAIRMLQKQPMDLTHTAGVDLRVLLRTGAAEVDGTVNNVPANAATNEARSRTVVLLLPTRIRPTDLALKLPRCVTAPSR